MEARGEIMSSGIETGEAQAERPPRFIEPHDQISLWRELERAEMQDTLERNVGQTAIGEIPLDNGAATL